MTITMPRSSDQAMTFAYNPASQIVGRTSSNDSYAFTRAANVARAYAVNGLNQYSAVGPNAYGYDANGNLTSDGISTYAYDAENRLVSSSAGVSLAYDPLGRLWQVSGSSGIRRFEYDRDRLIQEFAFDGYLVAMYAHGPGADEPLVWYDIVANAWALPAHRPPGLGDGDRRRRRQRGPRQRQRSLGYRQRRQYRPVRLYRAGLAARPRHVLLQGQDLLADAGAIPAD
jgi:hypothetical protein